MKVRYLARNVNHRRILRASDLARLGVGHDQDIVFESSNDWTVEMSDGACDTLVKLLPDEFVLLDASSTEEDAAEGDGNPMPFTLFDSASEEASEGVPDASLSEADATIDESPSARRRGR